MTEREPHNPSEAPSKTSAEDDIQGDTNPAGALSHSEKREARERTAIRAAVIHEAIRAEGEAELRRPLGALTWSGLAAGLSMGFSLATVGLLTIHLPDAKWSPLIANLG